MVAVRGIARYVCNDCGRDVAGAGRPAACLCGSTVRRRIDTGDAMFLRPADANGPEWDPLKHWRRNAAPARYDAHDLVERCLSAWQIFLTARGVSLPSW